MRSRPFDSPKLVEWLFISLLLFPLLFSPAGLASELPTVRIGRISRLAKPEAEKEVAPFIQYLNSKIKDYQFRIVLMSSDAQAMEASVKGSLDFLYVTPSVFVQLEVQSGAVAIATAKRFHGPDISIKYIGGVIFCKAERLDIQSFNDLRGKRVMGLNPLAMGGWLSALREFKEQGIDPKRDFSELRFGVNYGEVGRAVASGAVDVGVLSISELPLLFASGQYTRQQFRVLPPARDYAGLKELPVPASTRIYPGTAFVKMSHVSDELAEKVAVALFEMAETSKAAASILVAGWTLPMNYQPVHDCLKELRLPPYENYGKVTLWGAMRQHFEAVTLSLALLLGGLSIAMVAAIGLNRKLRRSQETLHQELEQRKKAERILTYQAALLAQTSDAVVATDVNYRTTFFNKAAERLFACESEESIGHQIEEIVPSFSESLPRKEIQASLEKQGTWSGEISFRNRSEIQIYAQLTVSRIEDSDRKATGSVIVIRDLTERRNLEEQLQQSHKLQAIGLLAGGVAHDFNNLLTVINGYTQLAAEKSELSDASRQYLEEVLNAGTRASELTQQLLAFGRKQMLQPQVIDLNRLVNETNRLLKRLIGEDIEIILKLDPQAGFIHADPGQMQQVIMNLAVNARDAMPSGGPLTLQTMAQDFSEELAKKHPEVTPGCYALLLISDTGQGMDEATIKRIFEPFFTTKTKGKGTGLGLSTVYGIIKQSDGHIWVQSEVGKGTTFTLCLPHTSLPQETIKTPRETRAPHGNETLLLVEDQSEVRNLAVKVLKTYGYKVLEANNGNAALRIFEMENHIDLLITDVIMPGLTGPELAAHLRERRPALKVLFISGYADEKLEHQGLINEATLFLQKPFSPNLLAMKVRELLSRAS